MVYTMAWRWRLVHKYRQTECNAIKALHNSSVAVKYCYLENLKRCGKTLIYINIKTISIFQKLMQKHVYSSRCSNFELRRAQFPVRPVGCFACLTEHLRSKNFARRPFAKFSA